MYLVYKSSFLELVGGAWLRQAGKHWAGGKSSACNELMFRKKVRLYIVRHLNT